MPSSSGEQAGMFSGVTVQSLGVLLTECMGKLYELQDDHDLPQGKQAAYLLHQARSNVLAFRRHLESYELVAKDPNYGADQVLIQKGFADAEDFADRSAAYRRRAARLYTEPQDADARGGPINQ